MRPCGKSCSLNLKEFCTIDVDLVFVQHENDGEAPADKESGEPERKRPFGNCLDLLCSYTVEKLKFLLVLGENERLYKELQPLVNSHSTFTKPMMILHL